MNCTSKEKYPSKDGRCCDRCPAGKHVKADCGATSQTRCEKCGPNSYTATQNHMTYCHPCRTCHPYSRQKTLRECTASQNTECECEPSFYCSNQDCDLCQPVTHCPPGEGVKLPATRTSNTVCAPCEDGTFSNVTDFISPCRAHIRCEDRDRELKTPGNKATDAVCGELKTQCPWILPAGLWSGLVLTAILLLTLHIWRVRRKAHRAVTLADLLPAPPVTPKQSCPHQESCRLTEDQLSLYIQQDKLTVFHQEDKLPVFHPEKNKLTVFHPEDKLTVFHPEDKLTVFHPEDKLTVFHPEDKLTVFHQEDKLTVFHPEDKLTVFHQEDKLTVFHPEDKLTVFHPEDKLTVFHPEDKLTVFHQEDKLTVFHPEDKLTVFHPEDKLPVFHPEDKLTVFHPEDKLPVFHQEDKLTVFHPEEEESLVRAEFPGNTAGHPITPLRTSAPPPDAPLRDGGSVSGNLLRTISEPQEDEWCGT